MKTFLIHLGFLAFSLTAFAGPKCARLVYYETGYLPVNYRQDLTSHIWQTDLFGKAARLTFSADGSAIALFDDSAAADCLTWTLEQRGQGMFLHLHSDAGDQVLGMTPTCDGLCVTGGGICTQLTALSEKKSSIEELAFVRSRILGTWEYTPERLKKKSKGPEPFMLSLREDGTFILATGPDSYHAAHEGIWMLSSDGNHLVICTKVMTPGQERLYPEALKIHSVDFEDLSLGSGKMPRVFRGQEAEKPILLSKVSR